MWQVLLAAAAAAGSGILAKKLINPPIDTQKPISDFNQNDQKCDQNEYLPHPNSVSHLDDGKIFRFSSPETGSKELKKNSGSGFRGVKKNSGSSKRGKKYGCVEGGRKEVVVDDDQRGNRSGKRITVCLKKRRTGKHVVGNCESCASKDNSFGWGVGVGIMYMMSTGKAEISRLNCAMDETAKVVHELKAEISRRKSSHNVNVLAENEAEANKKYIERSYNGPLFTKPSAKSKDKIKTLGPALSEEGECSSSVLTEEQQPEVLEMDQLEAELECELQKLPWCATEGSGSERRTDFSEAEVLAKECQTEEFENSNSYQYNGVLPVELDKKLSHLLIEQQESQIVELETELHQAHSKLHEKEAELRALKDCVKHEETDDHAEDAEARDWMEAKPGFESTRSRVGMKRLMDYDGSYICPTK
ncbi:hypothetical protein BUALT_Bualt09G0072500 [Buddleja alternifolia]|uniref:Uncharacterized protein n=1 Tax=Buddleja alternifolia TaxID=168488 RepID=A0AAV6XBD0_9LAMI|nr:hypothetical protein BUALT_Bualt09G0072500 [Buddleja alternifolia]